MSHYDIHSARLVFEHCHLQLPRLASVLACLFKIVQLSRAFLAGDESSIKARAKVNLLLVGRALLEEHAQALIRALLTNLGFKEDAGVRLEALRGLGVAAKLKYDVIHPYKRAVVKALRQAVDDPKRSLRAEAAKICSFWLPA